MITIFDCINDVLTFKKGTLLQNVDDEAAFNPYLVNRWISMYSPDCATIINNTANWLYPIFESKTEQYKFLVDILPSRGRKRITYFKKNKPDFKSSHANIISILATNLELSKREINDYIETGIIDISKLKKCYE
jgi:hypothetical protein